MHCRKRLNICQAFGDEYSFQYNSGKTECMHISKVSCNNDHNVYLLDRPLTWVQQCSYLGTVITSKLDDGKDICLKRCKFFSQVNNMSCTFGKIPSQLLNTMFVQFCCTFYGSQTWLLNHKKLHLLNTAYNRSVRRVWKIPWHSHTDIVHQLCGRASLSCQLMSRFLNMYCNMYSSDNCMLHYVAARALYDKDCPIGKNVSLAIDMCDADVNHNIVESCFCLQYCCSRLYVWENALVYVVTRNRKESWYCCCLNGVGKL